MKKLIYMATLLFSILAFSSNQYIANKSDLSFLTNVKVLETLSKNHILIETKQLPSFLSLPQNRSYSNSPIDFLHDDNDPDLDKQFHHQILSTHKIWEKTQDNDKEIIIAVTDNGFDLEHEDLIDGFWKNVNEIPNNGIDDDQNGFIDDYEGWDFVFQNNNPRPKGETSHGTHVAGIIMATMNNGLGVRGITPRIKVMPIKFFDGKKRWTSAQVVAAYYYAIDNGASIISTSYDIDAMVDDQAYLDALKYAEINNVLIVNSAGNSGEENPKRGRLDYPLLVCGTKSDPKRPTRKFQLAKFSNYGIGIDICAPSEKIYSTFKRYQSGNTRYGVFKGTSMATPMVAALGAYYKSKKPELSVSELKTLILKTSRNIDSENRRKYKGKMGVGLLDFNQLQL